MTRIILFSLALILTSYHTNAQQPSSGQQDLQYFINIRRAKFDAYSHSLEKRSGFFGNKTKKDLQRSHDALADIVETDNHIIGMLSQKENVRNYEKVNNNYNMLDQNDQIQRLQVATDTLAKQVDVLAASNALLKSKTSILKWALSAASALLIWLLFFRRKKNNT